MKKTIMGLSALLTGMTLISSPTFANINSLPKLQLQVVNTIKNQNFALCLSGSCYIMTGSHKPVIMDGNNINSIIMANTATLQMYDQAIPESCKLTVKDNETLTVSGKLIMKDMAVHVEHLKCSVTATEA